MKALLFTGGLDSTALAYEQRPDLSITIDYGQLPARGEIRAARAIAEELSLRHEVIRVDARAVGAGVLVGAERSSEEMPPEWWPYRNQLLITIGAARLAREGGGTLIIGTVRGDAAHCDGRPEFLEAIDHLLALQRPRTRVVAPALHLDAHALLKRSGVAPELLGWTFSCHVADVPCGHCRGCYKHVETLRLAYT